jgi:hypothetical protein
MNRTTIVYGIADPVTKQLRYVGKTITSLPRRFDAHLNNARHRAKRPSEHWMASLLKRGIRPEIFEIEVCAPGADWEEAEQFWIAYFRSIGCRLLNLAVGGGGITGFKATPEQRKRQSESLKGRVVSEETKRKIGAANAGRPHTERQRKLNGDAHRGEKSPTVKLTAPAIPFIRSLFAAGYSGTQVGSVFGITKQAADAVRHGESWAHVPDSIVDISGIVVPPIYRLRGEKSGTAKLNDAAVRDIRLRLMGNRGSRETGRSLASEYGVTAATISDIRTRKIWRHVA